LGSLTVETFISKLFARRFFNDYGDQLHSTTDKITNNQGLPCSLNPTNESTDEVLGDRKVHLIQGVHKRNSHVS